MSPTLLPAAALPSQVALHNDGTDQSLPPSLPFLHLWTGPDGLSRLNTSQLAGFQSKSVGGGAAPQWLRPFPGEVVACSSRCCRWAGSATGTKARTRSG